MASEHKLDIPTCNPKTFHKWGQESQFRNRLTSIVLIVCSPGTDKKLPTNLPENKLKFYNAYSEVIFGRPRKLKLYRLSSPAPKSCRKPLQAGKEEV